MCTDSPELLPVRQLAHIMRHLGHLIPRPGLILAAGGDRGYHNRALTILTRNKRPSQTVSSQTGQGGIVWRRTGESTTCASCPRRPENCLLPRKHVPEINEETQ